MIQQNNNITILFLIIIKRKKLKYLILTTMFIHSIRTFNMLIIFYLLNHKYILFKRNKIIQIGLIHNL